MDTLRRLRRLQRDLWLVVIITLLAETLLAYGNMANADGAAVRLGPRFLTVCVIVTGMGFITAVILLVCMSLLSRRLARETMTGTSAGGEG